MDTVLRQDLIDVALRATDAYLGVEKHAMKNDFATNQDIHDFSFYLSKAHDALTQLGEIDKHEEYMSSHVDVMMKLAKHDDSTLADLPYVHVPKSDTGEVEESVQIEEEASKGLAAKAAKSGISLSTLKKVYSRGVAAWRTGHRPGTTPQQWGMARVNSYITKGKTYHTADKDLHEGTKKKKSENLDDKELDSLANTLSWDDIADTYQKDEYATEEVEVLDEKLSAAARLKKQRDFRRTGVKRNIIRGMRLQRVSSPERLKQRSILAARRLLSKKFLRGRDKSQLSPQEKDLLEQRLKRLQELGVQATLAQRLMPKIRKIEQQRLKHKSK
jgi:hypothetical protein